MPLAETAIQEELSLAHCHAVISRAGFKYSTMRLDHGIDLLLTHIQDYENEQHDSGAILAIQLKSTINALIHNEHVHYVLDMKAYRKLKSPCAQPKLLVVYSMPRNNTEWLHCSHEFFRMQNCAYWISAVDLPNDVQNEESVTIRIPRANLFSVEAVQMLAAPLVQNLEAQRP